MAPPKKTHCKRGHEFTESNTKLAKGGARQKNPMRQCRACEKLRASTPEYRVAKSDGNLRRAYGITLAQRDAMLEAQGLRCACCGSSDPASKNGWQTDHDHATGRVRGIICWPCNRVLGYLGDNEIGVRETCARLLVYLRGGQ